MTDRHTRLLRWIGSLVAVLVVALAITVAVLASTTPKPGSAPELRKPHCYPHGVVPTWVRPGCE